MVPGRLDRKGRAGQGAPPMPRPTWHCHIAISLDGRIARQDGSYDWLEGYPAEAFGIEAFMAGLDAIVMGRASYEALRGAGDWPYPGIRTTVVTSRPLGAAPPGVEARSGPLPAIAAEIDARQPRLVWAFGGGQLLRGLIGIGRLDVLEMAVIPVVLGEGIPLFPPGTPETRLALRRCEPKAGGALHLVYGVGGA
jgi:dihydrofolate reductase